MLTGSCHCGQARWSFAGEPGLVKACNCTLCRRYGAIWAYDYEGERIAVEGPRASYVRADEPEPSLEILSCPACAGVLAWRGLRLDDQGRRRMAVNLRLADPAAVAGLPVTRFDGLDSFESLPDDGRCVRDLWF